MKLKIESALLTSAFEFVSKMAPPISGVITMRSDGKKLFIDSTAEVSYCKVVVPCEVNGEGEKNVSMNAVRDAIQGFDSINVVFDDEGMKINSKNYQVVLPVFDAQKNADNEKEDFSFVKLSSSNLDFLRESLKKVELSPASLSSWILLGIDLSCGFVACYDGHHMSVVHDESQSIKGGHSFLLPTDLVKSTLSTFGAGGCFIGISKGRVCVKNKTQKAVVSIPDFSDYPTLDAVKKVLDKLKGIPLVIKKDDMMRVLTNSKAVIANERAEIVYEEGVIKVQTSNGKLIAKIKAEGKCKKFRIDLLQFKEAFTKYSTSSVKINVGDQKLSISEGNHTTIVALNQG